LNLSDSTSNIDRIMGLFYAGCDPADTNCSGKSATKGFLKSRKRTNVFGVASGLPVVGSFTVGPVSRYWIECKRRLADTLATGAL
jgi:hypothetical protein